MRASTPRGPRRPATTTTRPRPTARAAARRRGRCGTCAGSPRPGALQHFFDDDLVCASVGVHPGLLRGIEPFPDAASSSPTTRATSRAGSSSATRSTSSPPRSARATRWTRKLQALCAQQVPGDTYRNLAGARRLFAARRSSTSSRRCGCCRYTYGASAFQCAMNGATGADRGRVSEEPVEDRAARARDRRRAS